MMAPPGAPAVPGQPNGLPRPPVMNPAAVSGVTAQPISSSGAPPLSTPPPYQANLPMPTNTNAQASEASH